MKDKKKIYTALMWVFRAVGLFSAYKLADCFIQSKKSAENYRKLRPVVEAGKKYTPGEVYRDLVEENDDFVGWISIEDTDISYPVMQTKENPDYYLRRNFNGQYSKYGVPYVDRACDVSNGQNIIIYGHNMKDSSMFTSLVDYTSYDYYLEHKIIRFDTPAEFGEYEVVFAFKIDVENTDFGYAGTGSFDNEDDFWDYCDNARKLSYYRTGTALSPQDTLLTLSTCEYTYDDGRFVVIAKKVASYDSLVYEEAPENDLAEELV